MLYRDLSPSDYEYLASLDDFHQRAYENMSNQGLKEE